MTLWTSAEAAAATGGRATCDWAVNGISIDTRTIEAGDLFVALTAARDGHEFVAQALAKGAGAALVSRIPEGVAPDAPLLVVDDVQTALEALGRAGRARTAARVVAVTGSVGKTSTKEMLRAVLSPIGRTHASVASYNNHWGVPLTLARMPVDTEYAVIEIGMNHPGEIAPLAKMAAPHVAMVTIVAPAHLEAFDSIDGIAREKASVFEGLSGGVAVYNADLPTSHILADTAHALGAKAVGFGTSATDFTASQVTTKDGVTTVQATGHGRAFDFAVNTSGAHFAINTLGVMAVIDALGIDLSVAAPNTTLWTPVVGRGAREFLPFGAGQIELIDEAYNANPTSMAAAFDVLAKSAGTRRIAFVGDMKELGPDAEALHRDMANLPALAQVDQIHCIGPMMMALHRALPNDKRGTWAETSDQMAAEVASLIAEGDVIMAKGSFSTGVARVVDAIRKISQTQAK